VRTRSQRLAQRRQREPVTVTREDVEAGQGPQQSMQGGRLGAGRAGQLVGGHGAVAEQVGNP